MSRVPLHPLLVAAFPVLFLWSQNVDEVAPGEVGPVLGAVVAGTVCLAGVVGLLTRDARRAAIIASVVAAVSLSYGHVAADAPPLAGLATAAVLVALGVVFAVRAGDEVVAGATRGANVIAAVLLATTLVPITSEAFAAAPDVVDLGDGLVLERPERPPDIYYIVLDRYGREDSLAEVFGLDNSAFTATLSDLGFDVASASLANYPKTAHSLAASLNLDYLDALAGVTDQEDWAPVYRLLREHRLGAALTAIGYDYIHLGTWWSPTATAASATRVVTLDRSTEFAQVFELTTLLPAVRSLFGDDAPLDKRERHIVHGEYQLGTLDELAVEQHADPRFVFAHIALPHEPYVFDADGTVVPATVARSRSRADNYARQLAYLNDRIGAFAAALVEHDPDALVVIQADEGPHPAQRLRQGTAYRWLEAPLAELHEKLRILSAYRLPGLDVEVPDSITPVNTFRLILSEVFGADLPPLPDRSYVFPDEDHLYTFVDVTDRVR